MCLLPENIVYFTSTQPVLGISAVYYQPGIRPILLQPESEIQWVASDSCEVVPFSCGHLGDTDFYSNVRQWCAGLFARFGQNIRTLGVELTSPAAAPTFSAAEMTVPDQTWVAILQEQFPGCAIADVTPGLMEARSIKSKPVLAQIRRCNQIAQLGLDALQKSIQPGMSEVEAAALVESEIRIRGTGFQGARLVKAFAQVTSGVEGTIQQYMLTPSGQRKFETGDLVMIEMAVCADGFWSDLTRVYCVGQPSERQKTIYNAVLQAQKAAAECLIPGNPWGSPDDAARKVLTEAGLGEYFIHGTGHGVGYKYHESIPQLGPNRREIFQEGMVTSVEPGVYIPGLGGIRIEDNLAVGADDPIWLSSPCSAW